MKIKKSELYNYIKSQLQGDCYVGLHGIADSSDLANQYSNLPKIDKARSIVEKGLINARGTTTGLTVRNFGNLNSTVGDKVNNFNNYGFYSPSGEQAIVVVAIPYFFEDSKGRKLFGGYKEYPTPSQYEGNNIPECITDYIFRDNIPSEMIMGYYSYNSDTDEVEYVENPNYYSRLTQAQKDAFIEKWFEPQLSYDVNNNETMENVRRSGGILGLMYGGEENSPVLHTASQYEQVKVIEESRVDDEITNNPELQETPNEELTPESYEASVQQKRLELSKRLDQFLSKQQDHKQVDEKVLNTILERVQREPRLIEWLEIKKITALSHSEEFKDQTDLLSYKDTSFDVQVQNNTLNNGNNNLLNGLMLLPVLCQPVLVPPRADHSAKIVVLYKIDCGNGKYIVKEVVKDIKNYEDTIRQMFAEIDRIEKEKGSITPEERKAIYDKILASLGITNAVSFTGDDFANSYNEFKQNFEAKYGIPLSDVNKNGESIWSLNDFIVIDNRPKIDGKTISLEEQVANNGMTQTNTNQNEIDHNDIDYEKWFQDFVPILVKNRKLRIRQIVKQELFYDIKSGEQACEFINKIFSDIQMPHSKEEMMSLTNKLIAENQALEKIVNLNDDNLVYPKRNIQDDSIYHGIEMGEIIRYKEKNIELKARIIQQKEKLSLEEITSLFAGLTKEIVFKESTDKEKWYDKPQDDLWFENEDLEREINGYSTAEIESIPTADINTSNIKNNFETVVLGKYGIKKELILGITNSKLIHSSSQTSTSTESLAKTYGFDLSNSNEETLVNDFENYLKSKGYNDTQIEKIYRTTYENNKPLCLHTCIVKAEEMISKSIKQEKQNEWDQYSSHDTKYLDHVLNETVKNKVNIFSQLDINKVVFTPRLVFGKFGDVYLECLQNDILLKTISDNSVFDKPYIREGFDPNIPTIKQVDVINGLKGMNQRVIDKAIEQKKITSYKVDSLLKDTYIRNKDYYDGLAKVELQRWKQLLTKTNETSYNEEMESETHYSRR